MCIIDFHNHVYPPSYIELLEKGPSAYGVTRNSEGNPVLHSPGDYNIAVPAHRCMQRRAEVLDAFGIDTQIISFTAPGTVIETRERSVYLSKVVNDAFAEIQSQQPKRFPALATLPLNDHKAAPRELERALTELQLKGVTVYSNINGVALSDRRYWPLWEVANAYKTVVFVHPTFPVGVEAMQEYMLMPLVGFLMDTTLAAASLVFAGICEQFPNIRWVLGHLGGTIPYLAERLDRGYEAYPECRKNISRPPSAYLKQFYYDTVNFDVRALQLAIVFAGVEHIVAGSDYPHQIGSIEKMLNSINALPLTSAEKRLILGRNAAQLLGLEEAGENST